MMGTDPYQCLVEGTIAFVSRSTDPAFYTAVLSDWCCINTAVLIHSGKIGSFIPTTTPRSCSLYQNCSFGSFDF